MQDAAPRFVWPAYVLFLRDRCVWREYTQLQLQPRHRRAETRVQARNDPPIGRVMTATLASAQHCSSPKPASAHDRAAPDGAPARFAWFDILKQY